MNDKLKALLQSRKFWALIVALVGVGTAAYTGKMVTADAINAAVAALMAYMVGTGLDNPTVK